MRTLLLMLVATVALAGMRNVDAAGGTIHTLLPSDPADSHQSLVWARRSLAHFEHPAVLTSETDGWQAPSCDQLYRSVTTLLVQLGARENDIHVDQRPCYSGSPLRSVDVRFSVVAADETTAKRDAAPVPAAHWQTIALRGDCVYLQYITKTVLPLFTTRNVKLISTADCIKTGIGLYAQLLKASEESEDSP